MTQIPALSIVTITYNNADGLARTLRSIADQCGLDERTELVVVDGASTDGTDQIMKDHAPTGVDVTYLSEPDRGVYDAMNKGAARARGSWLQFLNAGDTFADDRSLTAVLHGLAANPDKSWLVAGATHLGAGEQIKNLPYSRIRHTFGLQPHCHQSTFVRREAFERLGGYSEDFDFVGDFDLILRLDRGELPAELPRIVVAYEGDGMSAQRSSEIPWLLHRVRVERLSFGQVRTFLDACYSRARPVYVRLRRAVGSLVRRSTRAKDSGS